MLTIDLGLMQELKRKWWEMRRGSERLIYLSKVSVGAFAPCLNLFMLHHQAVIDSLTFLFESVSIF